MIRTIALAAGSSLCLFIAGFSAANANPLGIAFATTKNVPLYGNSTGMLIAGRCNRYHSDFTNARKKGAEVLAYINAASRPDHRVCALDETLYMNDRGQVPLWPYPSYGQRSIWANTRMTDLRAGSAWARHVVSYVEGLMREGKVDGVFLDVLGARPWGSLANWNNWSQSEKDAWTDGAIDLVKRLDARRRAVKPGFIIVVNNTWNRGDSRGYAGEKYVDGVAFEHPKGGSAWHVTYAKKTFANIGQRRLLVIANNKAEALAWAKVPGVTHVSDQSSAQYKNPNPPPVAFKVLN